MTMRVLTLLLLATTVLHADKSVTIKDFLQIPYGSIIKCELTKDYNASLEKPFEAVLREDLVFDDMKLLPKGTVIANEKIQKITVENYVNISEYSICYMPKRNVIIEIEFKGVNLQKTESSETLGFKNNDNTLIFRKGFQFDVILNEVKSVFINGKLIKLPDKIK